MHTLVGGGGLHGGFDALDYRKIRQGDAGPLGIYPILSVLPDKFARFLFEFHAVQFESLDLPLLPADRSDFDVHGALEDDKVRTEKHCCVLNIYCYVLYILFHLYALTQLNQLYLDIMLLSLWSWYIFHISPVDINVV